jgi:two-component system, NtrC family, sensor kinase
MAAPAEVTNGLPPPESATTLRTIVDLVRRITHADVTSIVSFSQIDQTITWRAASGFRVNQLEAAHPLIRPLTNELAQRVLGTDSVTVVQGIDSRPDQLAGEYSVHASEGVQDLALAPLKIRGQTIGALVAAYRAAHNFTEEEKQVLTDLAAIAALALDNARLAETVGTAEKIWEQTFDAIAEGILVHNADMKVVRCNAKAAEMLEMQPNDVIGLSFSEVFERLFGKRAADYYMAGYRGASTVVEIQTEYRRRYLVSVSPLHDSGKSGSVVAWNDVTRLSEIQDQLGRTRRLASVGQLAAGVAHEINNPLAAITTCAEATMRDMRTDSDMWKTAESRQWTYYLEEIVRQSLRCKEITSGLLDLTRQRQANRAICNLNEIATESGRTALQRATANVEFELNLDETIGQVATDHDMVRQILDNFLSNAIDALAERAGKITVSTRRDGDRVSIEVGDTGMGIPADLLSRIFDPFFSTKGPGKGYGLGLAICLTLAETLGGGITVNSKPDGGSRFRLWIPRRAPER